MVNHGAVDHDEAVHDVADQDVATGNEIRSRQTNKIVKTMLWLMRPRLQRLKMVIRIVHPTATKEARKAVVDDDVVDADAAEALTAIQPRMNKTVPAQNMKTKKLSSMTHSSLTWNSTMRSKPRKLVTRVKLPDRVGVVALAGVVVAIETQTVAVTAIPIANHEPLSRKRPAAIMNSTTTWIQTSKSTTTFVMKIVKTIPIERIAATFHPGMKRSRTLSRRIRQVAKRADVRGDGAVARATAMIANGCVLLGWCSSNG